jgi:hypothetical protein
LCQEKYEEDYNFDCPGFSNESEKPELTDGTEWYSVCGNPHSNKTQYVAVTLVLSIMGIFVYRTAFSSRNEKSKLI